MDKIPKSIRGIRPTRPRASRESTVHPRHSNVWRAHPNPPPPMPLVPAPPPPPPSPPPPPDTSIKAYWHVCSNFGDALTPYLIEKISGEKARFVQDNTDPELVMVTGSLLSYNVKSGIIWGSGSAFKSDLDSDQFAGPSTEFRIVATRGFLSKQLVETKGHRPIAYGDPGLLLPNYYTPNVSKKYDLGIMCSWVDYEQVMTAYGDDERITVINSMMNAGEDSIESIIDRISECENLVTSTLHGLVAAVAYGVPTVSVKFSDKMVGDGFKYQDFLSCTDKQYSQIDLRDITISRQDLINLSSVHKLLINTGNLLECCPFRSQL